MTLQELLARKHKFETDVAALVGQFDADTGGFLTEIDIDIFEIRAETRGAEIARGRPMRGVRSSVDIRGIEL